MFKRKFVSFECWEVSDKHEITEKNEKFKITKLERN